MTWGQRGTPEAGRGPAHYCISHPRAAGWQREEKKRGVDLSDHMKAELTEGSQDHGEPGSSVRDPVPTLILG